MHTQTKYKYGSTRVSDLSNIAFNRDDIGCQLYSQLAKWSMNLTNNLQIAWALLLHTALRAMHKVDKVAACTLIWDWKAPTALMNWFLA